MLHDGLGSDPEPIAPETRETAEQVIAEVARCIAEAEVRLPRLGALLDVRSLETSVFNQVVLSLDQAREQLFVVREAVREMGVES